MLYEISYHSGTQWNSQTVDWNTGNMVVVSANLQYELLQLGTTKIPNVFGTLIKPVVPEIIRRFGFHLCFLQVLLDGSISIYDIYIYKPLFCYAWNFQLHFVSRLVLCFRACLNGHWVCYRCLECFIHGFLWMSCRFLRESLGETEVLPRMRLLIQKETKMA